MSTPANADRMAWADKDTLRISEVRKGMRVQLAFAVPVGRARGGAGIGEPGRVAGTVLSPRAFTLKRPYEEGIGVRVLWDGFRTPEFWHLADLMLHPLEYAKRACAPPSEKAP